MSAQTLFRRLMTRTLRTRKPATHHRPLRTVGRPIEPLEDRIVPALIQNFDGVVAPALPSGWITVNNSGSATPWTTTTATPNSAPNAAFINNLGVTSDNALVSPSFTYTAADRRLSFRNFYQTESGFDFASLEISINGGAFTNIVTAGGTFTSGAPNSAGTRWTGNSGGYVTSTVDMPVAGYGQPVQLRWRLTTDSSVSAPGWRIDDITNVRLFGVSGAGGSPSMLYELNPANGAILTTIGSTGMTHVTDIAIHPITGVMYGVSNTPQQLITINTATGVATPVGPTGVQIPDIGFRPDGTLFGWAEFGGAADDDLVTINLTTGATTLIPSPVLSQQTGLAFNSGGDLYVKAVNFAFTAYAMHRINPATGAVLSSVDLNSFDTSNVLDVGPGDVFYSAFRAGGPSGPSDFQTINPTTGVVTTLGFGTIAAGITGLAHTMSFGAPPSLLASIDGGGNLVITDVSLGGRNNTLTATVSGANFVITDATEQFITPVPAGGVLSNGNRTLTIPFGAFAGANIIVNGAGGNDALTQNFATGNFPKTVTFNGGGQTDALNFVGGAFAAGNFNYASLTTGTVLYAPNATNYTGIASIGSTVPTSATIFLYGTAAETITLSAGGAGQTVSTSTAGATTTVANPSAVLGVGGGDGADTILVNGLGSGFAGSLILDGQNAVDTAIINTALNLAGAGAALTVTSENIEIPTATIATSGNQTYNGSVFVGANATLSGANVLFNGIVNSSLAPGNYTFAPIGIGFIDISGTGTAGPTGDDQTLTNIPIGFNFNYYGALTSIVSICSNGFISLTNDGSTSFSPTALPNVGTPNGTVAGWWEDLYPPGGGSIRYQTVGAPGSRIFIAQWTSVPHFFSGNLVTFQIQLREGSNLIEVHLPNGATDGGNHSIGVENATGTVGTSAFFSSTPQIGTAFRFTPVPMQYSLTVNSVGATTFNGIVGAINPLGALTTNAGGTTALNAPAITTIGAMTFGDAVTLTPTVLLTSTSGGDVLFASTLNGPGGLTVNTGGTTAFNGATGTGTPLASLTTDTPGSTSLGGGAVAASGNVAFNDPVQLAASATVNGANVLYGNTVNPLSTVNAPYVVSTPAFNFIDIAGTGSAGPTGDDQAIGNIPIGFNFNYFGVLTNLVAICSNGWISATNNTTVGSLSPTAALPNAGTPNGTIAGWWVDLYPPGGGTIRYQTVGAPGSRIFIVQWTSVPHFSSGNLVTFQIQLHEGSNRIEVHLPTAPSNGNNHAIGVENGTGTVGTSAYFSTAALPANSAFRFSPTLTTVPASLTTNSTATTTFTGVVGGTAPLVGLTTNAGTNLTLGAASTTTGATMLNFGTGGAGGTANINGAITAAIPASLNGGAGADIANLNVSSATALNVTGGAGNDTVNFANGVTLSGGTLDGGANTDTVNYSAYATPVAVNLGSTPTGGTLSASLNGLNEVVFNSEVATASAVLSNYNPVTKTFDIAVTATNLPPGSVTGFHIHRGAVGANGPVIIDLMPLAPLIPAGSGFTFNAVGVSIATSLLGGLANEAAFLGGITYLNIHTATFPGGIIRGQVYPNAAFAAAAGTATGTAGISNVENATGGSANDSLVGTLGVNALFGNAGNDTLVGAPGNDIMDGGANDDILVWSNGDNNDVMDGGLGTDAVQVNGAVAANDLFTVGNGPGGRIAFVRSNLVPFALDIGTSETLAVNGIGGDDSMTVNSLTSVLGLTTLNLNGGDGSDTFNVLPDANAVINVAGGNPIAAPGDTLILNAINLTAPIAITDPTGTPGSNALPHGRITSGNAQTVNWTSIETLPVPLGLGGSFDFVTASSTVQPGFLPVRSTDTPTSGAYTAAQVGWVNPGAGDYDRFLQFGAAGNPNSPQLQQLLRTGEWGYSGGGVNNGLFQVAVAPGPLPGRLVQVTAYVGDNYAGRDTMNVYVRNLSTGTKTKLNPNLKALNTTGTDFQFVAYGGMIDPGAVASPGNTKVLLQIEVEAQFGGATAFWTIQGVDVRPLGLIAPLTIAPVPTPLSGDGTSVDVYTGTGAAPNAELTVSAQLGTVSGVDADPVVKGFQIVASPTGSFTFSILRPAGSGNSIISVRDVTGATATGFLDLTSSDPGTVLPNPFLLPNAYVQPYTAPASPPPPVGVSLNFDFNSGPSPTQPGFTGVQGDETFSPGLGRGWTTGGVGSYDRAAGGNPAALFRDGAWGAGSATYQVAVPAGNYDVRMYVGDPYQPWHGITVSAGAQTVAVDLAANPFGYVTLYNVPAVGGFLTTTITAGAQGYWVAAGIQFATSGQLPAPATPAAAVLSGVRRLDFNGSSADTTPGFTAGTGAAYTPATGYGWQGSVQTLERTASSLPLSFTPAQVQLYRDAAWGQGVNVFQVAVPSGAANAYQARVYVGDSHNNWPGLTLQMEGGALVNANTSANPFWSYILNGSDVNGDGVLTVTVTGQVWVMNGIEVVQTAGTSVGVLPASVGPAGAPQLSAEGYVKGRDAAKLAFEQLAPIFSEAVDRWIAAGITPEQLAILKTVKFDVVDMGVDDHLGLTELHGKVVLIDDDAAGHGWYIDSTPADDTEFGNAFALSELGATDPAAANRYDLLTVMVHELGHTFGLDSLDPAVTPQDLMTATLPLGIRRLPALGTVSTEPVPVTVRSVSPTEFVAPSTPAPAAAFVEPSAPPAAEFIAPSSPPSIAPARSPQLWLEESEAALPFAEEEVELTGSERDPAVAARAPATADAGGSGPWTWYAAPDVGGEEDPLLTGGIAIG